MSITVDYQIVTETPNLPSLTNVNRWVKAAVRLHLKNAAVTVRIVDTEEGTTLNRQFRQQDKPTNVLSFPSEIPEKLNNHFLGDLVLCAPVIRREAAEQHKAEAAHWAHMIVHGCLHLLGFDHIKSSEAEKMERLEINILRVLGCQNPYE